MGNKCCSKRQEPDGQFSYQSGYKKADGSLNSSSGPKLINGGSLDSRYTPDPNRGQIKAKPGGVDIIRPRPCKYINKHDSDTLYQLTNEFVCNVFDGLCDGHSKSLIRSSEI